MMVKKTKDAIIASENFTVLKRRKKALEFRLLGLSYEQIYMQMLEELGEDELPPSYSASNAYNDVKWCLNEVKREMQETAKEVVIIELTRLDALYMTMYNLAMAGDVRAVDKCLKIMERRAKLLGLDKPSQVKVSDWRSEVLALLASGKLTIEQVKDELGEEVAREIAESRGVGRLEAGEITEGIFTEKEKIVAG